jgi:N-acetylneuraminate synthase
MTTQSSIDAGDAFAIGQRTVGPGNPALIIAEIAQAHDGSLGMAHAFIDAVADTGADAIKFQTHIAEAESTLDEPFRVRSAGQDRTRFDYWRRMEFTLPEWCGLAKHAGERGLIFLSSAFSIAAIELLKAVGVAAWKVGSGDYASRDLWNAMAATGAPILFSTGMATRGEIDSAVALFRARAVPFALLQCTSAYPVALEEVGLNVLEEFRSQYRCPVGLSDHSGGPYPGLAAISRKADILEIHVTFIAACLVLMSKRQCCFRSCKCYARCETL